MKEPGRGGESGGLVGWGRCAGVGADEAGGGWRDVLVQGRRGPARLVPAGHGGGETGLGAGGGSFCGRVIQ